MDIAKYIGLYLLKNHFCYLHGLGNLQLRKKPAAYTGEALTAPQYDVVLLPGGSIDDNLANFIATAEQTSISKAANNLRDFITSSRAALLAGDDVAIPAIGRFTQKNGVLDFVTDPHLAYTPPSIPALKMSKRLEEPPSFRRATAEEEAARARSGSINWGKAILTVAALAGLVTGVVLGIRYLDKPAETQPPATTAPVQQQPAPQAAAVPPADTTAIQQPVAAPAPTATPSSWRIVLNAYPTRVAAEKRARRLRTTPLGDAVTIVAADSSTFRVVIPYSAGIADSTRVLDSLSRTYGARATLLR